MKAREVSSQGDSELAAQPISRFLFPRVTGESLERAIGTVAVHQTTLPPPPLAHNGIPPAHRPSPRVTEGLGAVSHTGLSLVSSA